MSEIPPVPAGESCPNCENVTLTNNNWCPKCGYNKNNITFDDDIKNEKRFEWLWYWSLFCLVPIGACGGCVLSDWHLALASIIVTIISVVAGFALLIYRSYSSRQ